MAPYPPHLRRRKGAPGFRAGTRANHQYGGPRRWLPSTQCSSRRQKVGSRTKPIDRRWTAWPLKQADEVRQLRAAAQKQSQRTPNTPSQNIEKPSESCNPRKNTSSRRRTGGRQTDKATFKRARSTARAMSLGEEASRRPFGTAGNHDDLQIDRACERCDVQRRERRSSFADREGRAKAAGAALAFDGCAVFRIGVGVSLTCSRGRRRMTVVLVVAVRRR